MVPCQLGWSDIGSWQAVRELSPVDAQGNYCNGEAVLHDVSNCYIDSPKRLVGAIGLDNLIIIDTPDALLIADGRRSQEVKIIAQELKRQGHDAYRLHRTVTRPWGTYTVLEEGKRFKIKRIVVRPQASLSLQMHHHRSEHWIVVSGMATVTNGEREFMLDTNESTFIKPGHTPSGQPRRHRSGDDRGAERRVPGRRRHRAFYRHLWTCTRQGREELIGAATSVA